MISSLYQEASSHILLVGCEYSALNFSSGEKEEDGLHGRRHRRGWSPAPSPYHRAREKLLIATHRRRWEYNIRTKLKEIAVKLSNWVDSAQDRDY